MHQFAGFAVYIEAACKSSLESRCAYVEVVAQIQRGIHPDRQRCLTGSFSSDDLYIIGKTGSITDWLIDQPCISPYITIKQKNFIGIACMSRAGRDDPAVDALCQWQVFRGDLQIALVIYQIDTPAAAQPPGTGGKTIIPEQLVAWRRQVGYREYKLIDIHGI